jgi:blue copper oxidase
MGYYGDEVLVNLTPKPYLEVGARPYRFRILNGSNARVYRLAFERTGDGVLLPYQMIGTDGGLLDRPYLATEVFLSPGERADVLLDLSRLDEGEPVALKSLAFDPMDQEDAGDEQGMSNRGGMAGMDAMAEPALPSGGEFYALKLVVGRRVPYAGEVPEVLSTLPPPPEVTGTPARLLRLSLGAAGGAPRWLIAGRAYDLDEYPIEVGRGVTEVWELANDERSMPHPMHQHGALARVLGREGSPEQVRALAVDGAGRTATDLGFKDTVLVWPGETVKVAMDFSHPYASEQVYTFHCHILEHEEAGMMVNVRVL